MPLFGSRLAAQFEVSMPWRTPRPLPDTMRDIAMRALEHGLQVCVEDEGGELQLWVSHADAKVYQLMKTQDQLDAFIQKWTR
jgi:hypothetical protein